MKKYILPTAGVVTTAIVYERYRMAIYKQVPANDLSKVKRPKVVVIGGGIIGSMTAFYLNKNFDVTLVDKNKKDPFSGSSFYQSGVIDPYCSVVTPWTTYSLIMMFYDCIFHWKKNRFSIDFWDFVKNGKFLHLAKFWYYHIVAKQHNEIKESRDFGHKLCMVGYDLIEDLLNQIDEGNIPRNLEQDQYIFFKEGEAQSTYNYYKKLGTADNFTIINTNTKYQNLLTEAEKKYFDKYNEVLITKVHLSNRRLVLANSLKYLTNNRSNFTKIWGEVKQINSSNDQIKSVTITDLFSEDQKEINIDCDLCIVCKGIDTNDIKIIQDGKTSKLNNVPLLPCRGYGVELKPKDEFMHLSLNKCYIDAFWYFTYQGHEDKRIRVASFWDYDWKPSDFQLKERVDYMMSKIKHVFGDDYEVCSPIGTGLRPISPNDTPIVNKSWKYQNLYFNIGHGSKEFMYSIGSAIHLNNIIEKNHKISREKGDHAQEILDKYKPEFALKYFI